MTEPVTGYPEPREESSSVDKGKKIGASPLSIRMNLVMEYQLRVKLVFSKKATKIDKIFTVDLTLTT